MPMLYSAHLDYLDQRDVLMLKRRPRLPMLSVSALRS